MMGLEATFAGAAKVVGVIGVVGGGALTMNNLHVAASDFEKYIEQQQMSDEREYVLDVKKEIRDIKLALLEHPSDEYLSEALAEAIADLCELRPEDKLCEEG